MSKLAGRRRAEMARKLDLNGANRHSRHGSWAASVALGTTSAGHGRTSRAGGTLTTVDHGAFIQS